VSIRDWCDRHGVSEPSFYFWRRELARRREQRQGASPQIVPVEVAPPVADRRWDLEIELPGRILAAEPGCNPDSRRSAFLGLASEAD
jgi:transposase-like protein